MLVMQRWTAWIGEWENHKGFTTGKTATNAVNREVADADYSYYLHDPGNIVFSLYNRCRRQGFWLQSKLSVHNEIDHRATAADFAPSELFYSSTGIPGSATVKTYWEPIKFVA